MKTLADKRETLVRKMLISRNMGHMSFEDGIKEVDKILAKYFVNKLKKSKKKQP